MTSRCFAACALACACSLALWGCGADTLSGPAPGGSHNGGPEIGEAESFQGTLGRYTFSAPNAEVRVESSPYDANVRIDAVSVAPTLWTMVSVTLTGLGGLRNRQIAPGAHLSTTRPGEVTLSALGCTGERRDVLNFDATADRVDVDVFHGSRPDRIRMVVTAWFTYQGRSQGVRGAFEYDAR